MANTKKKAPQSRATRKGARVNAPKTDTRRDFVCILFFGLAALMLFAACFRPDEYSNLFALRVFASGLMGFMTWTLPLAFAGVGVLAYRSSGEGRQLLKYCLLITALELCVLAAVEAFYCADIISGMEIKRSYVNFLSFAYRARTGGGLLGALLGWPLFRMLTKWGALLACVMLILLILIALRILSIRQLSARLSKSVQTYKEKHPPREKAPRAVPANIQGRKAKLYTEKVDIDDIGYIDTDSPPKLPKLTRGKQRAYTPVKAPGDNLVIPDVGAADAYPDKAGSKGGKGARKGASADTNAAPFEIEKLDLMEAVRGDSDEKRNADYINNALRDHARTPKPVTSYTRKPPKAKQPEARPEAEFAPPPVKPKPPAEPKPSFFDIPEPPAQPDERPEPKRPSAPDMTEYSNEYDYPPIDLMEAGEPQKADGGYDAMDMQNAEVIVKTLQSFKVAVKITGISRGPAVTRFELLPAPGIKVSRIPSYADDIAMNLAAISVRVEAPIPGKNAVGVEVPNQKREVVRLRDVLESREARKEASRLAVGLGKDNSGKHIVVDLADMPHVLVAGQTGSGKSVCINAIIISILFRATPEEVRMILIDPKKVELEVYKNIPHLLVPVVTDPVKAASALDWAVSEMVRRYKVFSEYGSKNIQSFNGKLPPDELPMPQIVVIVDELSDLMLTAPKEVETNINRLAQLARAAGIHLVIATQRPSVDVITGLIKANIPTRIAFTVTSGTDSRTILDSYGAEKLLGRGDMLYKPSDLNKPMRIQGAWVSEAEVNAVVDYVSNSQPANFDEEMIEHMENAALSDAEKRDKNKEAIDNEVDELFEQALRAVVDAGQASISMLQRKLRVGYARAGRLIDEMAARNYVSQTEGSKAREVLITREQLRVIFGDEKPFYEN